MVVRLGGGGGGEEGRKGLGGAVRKLMCLEDRTGKYHKSVWSYSRQQGSTFEIERQQKKRFVYEMPFRYFHQAGVADKPETAMDLQRSGESVVLLTSPGQI